MLYKVVVLAVAVSYPFAETLLQPQLRADSEEQARDKLDIWLKDTGFSVKQLADGSPEKLEILLVDEETGKPLVENEIPLSQTQAEAWGKEIDELKAALVDKDKELADTKAALESKDKELADTKALLALAEEELAKKPAAADGEKTEG